MTEHRVSLKEFEDDKFTIMFDCWADDEDHAIEQAEMHTPMVRY